MIQNIHKFQKSQKIKFKNISLLIEALTHKSANSKTNNEKFLSYPFCKHSDNNDNIASPAPILSITFDANAGQLYNLFFPCTTRHTNSKVLIESYIE